MAATLGVITDTHVGDELERLPEEALELLDGVDAIIHAGDLVRPDVLADLESVAPVVAVAGNHDPPGTLPRAALVRAGGRRVAIVHGVRPKPIEYGSALLWATTGRLDVRGHCRALARQIPRADLVVFGHVHIPITERIGATTFYSPGPLYQPELDPDFSWDGVVRRLYARIRLRIPPADRLPAVGIVEIAGGRITLSTRHLRRPIHPLGPLPA